MATDYPESLPLPLKAGYGMQTVSPLQRTELDSGRTRQRRRFSSVPINVSVSWLFTQAEAQVFESWFRYGISDGAEWFACRLSTPYGTEDYDARFNDIYSGPELVGVDCWRYTASIEIRERKTIPIDWALYGFEYLASAGLFDAAINQEWPQQ